MLGVRSGGFACSTWLGSLARLLVRCLVCLLVYIVLLCFACLALLVACVVLFSWFAFLCLAGEQIWGNNWENEHDFLTKKSRTYKSFEIEHDFWQTFRSDLGRFGARIGKMSMNF